MTSRKDTDALENSRLWRTWPNGRIYPLRFPPGSRHECVVLFSRVLRLATLILRDQLDHSGLRMALEFPAVTGLRREGDGQARIPHRADSERRPGQHAHAL